MRGPLVAALALLVAPIAKAQECRDPNATLSAAEREVVNYYLAEARASLTATVEAFGCSGKATAEQTARVFLAEGMLRSYAEDQEGTARAFAAARAIAPDQWNEDYGTDARELWANASVPDGAKALLTFKNLADDDWIRVDSQVWSLPVKVGPGFHLLQVGADDLPRFARILDVEPAGDLTITLPALVDVPASNVDAAVTVADPPTKNRRKQRGITALISAGAAGALYGGAIGARVAYDANPSDALYTTVDGLAISSGVVGVFAGTMGIWTLATPAP